MSTFGITYLGGPTAVIEYGGLRLLVDPTFDGPRDFPLGNRVLTKTVGPALTAAEVGPVDAVLLSHDQHPDNMDESGRAVALAAPQVLSTSSAEQRLGAPVRALPNWTSVTLSRPGGGEITVTGVPAQHGPDGSEPIVGEVTGFWLAGAGLPTVYVSGDNASLDVVRRIVDRLGTADIAVLFAGAARTPLVPDAPLTLTSPDAARAAELLAARHVVPLHFEHWAHFSEDGARLDAAFTAAGLADRLHRLAPGGHIAF
ncbi:MBL fold metallo-hydrolase [Streptacidiphilus anmyonensis]|uniref:MBL fold metallo-hydrolase n=1 Tax=Streptacidiphilus anmyonensis TaxID=405782 RepID=UPI0005A6F974|nr:MBL fold metallo-hydrolase [Streptacidiphilus anmyonensis]